MNNTRTRILLATIRLHSTYGRCTVRAVAADVGRSINSTHRHLRALRLDGLVAWEDYTSGTLRPLVGFVEEWAA